ncbi:MAG: DMT family transporter [Candidatus Peribacteraceae bacterium]|nr:DMT family transporter [Candidatus Peribacteraceae bacterium]
MKHIHSPYTLRHRKQLHALEKTGYVFAIGSVLFDGTYGSLAKGLTEFLSPVTLLILTESLVAAFVVVTIGLLPLIKLLSKLKPKQLLIGIVVGCLNSGIAPYLWFTGLKNTTAVNAAMLSSVDLLFILLYGRLLLKEKLRPMQLTGAGIAAIGIGIIAIGRGGESFGIHMGDMLIIAAGAVFSLGTVLFKKYLIGIHPEVALFLRNISGIFLISVFGAIFGSQLYPELSVFPVASIAALLTFAFFSRFLNLSLLYSALDKLPATSVALIQNATPISGMIFASLILHETIGRHHMLGAIFIVLGLLIENVSADNAKFMTQKLLRYSFRAQEST